MAVRESFNLKLNKDIVELYESLYESLGPPKYKIIEAAIQVFAALPKQAQYVLKSQDEEDREAILAHIRELSLKSKKGKTA